MTQGPTIAGRIIALLVGLLLFAAVAELGLRIAMPQWSEFYSGRFMRAVYDEQFGAMALGTPGFDGWFAQNNGDFRAHIHINDFGLRNDEPVTAADGAIWVVGDSMTFGWGVEEDERYSTLVGKLLGRPTYNIASPGTNVCGYRALLSRMPETVRPAALIVGLVLENDLMKYDCAARAAAGMPNDNASLIGVKIWLTGHSALYNVLAVSLKRVDVVRQALIAVGVVNEEQAYKLEFDSAQAAAVATSTADNLTKLCQQLPTGTPCAVLVIPSRFEIANDNVLYHDVRSALEGALAENGIDSIDPIAAFKEAGFQPTHFAHDGHWSPLGHKIAAAAVAEWLRNHAGS